jgi:histidinol phosphatase-like PHP family hydrolase
VAAETQTALELNNSVFEKHMMDERVAAAYANMVKLSTSCGAPLVVGSDAHVATKIGRAGSVAAFLKSLGGSSVAVLNDSPQRVEEFLKHPKGRADISV